MSSQDAERRLETLTAHSLNLLDQLLQAKLENRELAGGDESAESLRSQLAREADRATHLSAALEELKESDRLRATAVRELCGACGLTEESSIGQAAERVRGLTHTLSNYERWIASLLSELTGRRFKIGRRELLDGERQFLERQSLEQQSREQA